MALLRMFARERKKVADDVRTGAYLHSSRDLFRVEDMSGTRAVIEDCRSGHLIDVPRAMLLHLEPVRPART